jgi:tetratricopeptide (TPR) repeat protein
MTPTLLLITNTYLYGQTDIIKIGRELIDAKKYQDAVDRLSEAIQKDSKNKEAYYLRSLAYHALEEFKKELSDLNEVLKLDPKYAKALAQRGQVYIILREVTKGLNDFENAIKLEPNNDLILLSYGYVCRFEGEYEKAVIALTRVCELDPRNGIIRLSLAKLLAGCPEEKVRNGKKALELSKRAYELMKSNTDLCMEVMAMSYAELGDFDEAIKWQKKGIETIETDQKEFPKLDLTSRKDGAKDRLKLYENHKPIRYNKSEPWNFGPGP